MMGLLVLGKDSRGNLQRAEMTKRMGIGVISARLGMLGRVLRKLFIVISVLV